ncbi:hypothetical protein CRENBAI_009302 [Crenichthys baileyi]|uniref:Uncharacterized protein n=1 Tax=Crenichthys baileyi TaxID=28760 RepID=A0AAV9SK62_9TELE
MNFTNSYEMFLTHFWERCDHPQPHALTACPGHNAANTAGGGLTEIKQEETELDVMLDWLQEGSPNLKNKRPPLTSPPSPSPSAHAVRAAEQETLLACLAEVIPCVPVHLDLSVKLWPGPVRSPEEPPGPSQPKQACLSEQPSQRRSCQIRLHIPGTSQPFLPIGGWG